MKKQELIPNTTGRSHLTAAERKLFPLPLNTDGLNILTPDHRGNDFDWSKLVTSHFNHGDVIAVETKPYETVNQIKTDKQELQMLKISALAHELDESKQYSVSLVSETEKGASCLHAAWPWKRYGFNLTKSEFRDVLSLR